MTMLLALALLGHGGCKEEGGGEDADDALDGVDETGDDADAGDAPDDAGDPDGAETMVDHVTVADITFTFDRAYPAGLYANGDWWVLGPVTITSMTPDFDGTHHGWEVNPVVEGPQGFDERAGNFDASLVPALPYTASPGQSVVKTQSVDIAEVEPRPSVKQAAVLTVVAGPPADGGATIFRPPYVGTDKPDYSTTDLRTGILPSLAPVENAPEITWVVERYRPVQLDHKEGATGRQLHPADHMPDYGADIGMNNADAALRLMLDDPLEDRMQALVVYVQYGIDLYHMLVLGHEWGAGGGHRPGQKLPLSFAAAVLDSEAMRDAVRGADFFHEDVGTYASDVDGTVLFGFADQYWSEENYWETFITDTGFRSSSDPYGAIDGGPVPGSGYQFCCISQPWKGSALAVILMPEMADMWTDQTFFDYVDRWVDFGAWTQPDPCAPGVGVCSGGDNAGAACTTASAGDVCTGTDAFCDMAAVRDANYGVTYGPDGSGGCILDTDPGDGTGRFPQLHGTNADDGYRLSEFQRSMWNAYR